MKFSRTLAFLTIASNVLGAALTSLLYAEPAIAMTVVDDSGHAIQPNDLAKILSIMSPVGGDIQGLRQASGRGNERYYCGRIQVGSGFVPFLVNVFADQKYVLDSSDQDAGAKISAFGCM
jgi:hypothetical protein